MFNANENYALNITTVEQSKDKGTLLAKFLADTGATKHVMNSKLIFKSLCGKTDEIKCANESENANMKSEGEELMYAYTENDKFIEIEKVICAENLSENLISLRKFVDKDLSIYLDNKQMNVYNPKSNERFVTGIYKQPYWIIRTISERALESQCNKIKF